MRNIGRTGRWLLIAAGYGASLAAALAVSTLWYAALPADVLRQSGGMAAFGQFALFCGTAGFLGLAPTFFLLRELAGAGTLWKLLAAGGAAAGLTALAAEAAVAALFLGGGFRYVYPDPAFFGLDWLAWLHYKAPFFWRFAFSPAALAALLCLYLAAPRSGARRVLGWAALAELSASLFGALRVFLLVRNHIFHP